MSDEQRERARRIGEQLAEMFRPVVKAITEVARALTKFVDVWRKVAARERWRQAQQTARTLSRHPDLAALDRWFDRMYADPAFA